MTFDPDRHHRRSIRLPGYDYAQAGAYFITIVTHGREPLFGEIMDGAMQMNRPGRTVARCWLDIPRHFPNVALDAYVVMPNHVHGVIVITGSAGANPGGEANVGAKNLSPLHTRSSSPIRSPSKAVGSVVRGFKTGVTKWFRANTNVYTVWQRNYYERVIRNADEIAAIRHYIAENPQRWDEDAENPG